MYNGLYSLSCCISFYLYGLFYISKQLFYILSCDMSWMIPKVEVNLPPRHMATRAIEPRTMHMDSRSLVLLEVFGKAHQTVAIMVGFPPLLGEKTAISECLLVTLHILLCLVLPS